MRFSDEYELELNDSIYYVQVEGLQELRNKVLYIQIKSVVATDHLGEPIDSDHEHYEEIVKNAKERDYDAEVYENGLDEELMDEDEVA
jgi:hypothetical protein